MKRKKQMPYSRTTRTQKSNAKQAHDPIFSVMLVQILLCTVLLAGLLLCKKVDTDLYYEIKSNLSQTQDLNLSSSVIADSLKTMQANYDYANALFSDFLQPNSEELTGQGGWNPVEPKDKSKGKQGLLQEEMMAPPKNASFAPVMTSAKLLAPISGRITSDFGYRYHPTTNKLDFHTGMDIAALKGTDILAVLPGMVCEVGNSAIYGNYIVLEHSTGFKTAYSHCDKIIAEVGANIKRGERIAKVGSTGISTGPHLHFEIKSGDVFFDPAWVLF